MTYFIIGLALLVCVLFIAIVLLDRRAQRMESELITESMRADYYRDQVPFPHGERLP